MRLQKLNYQENIFRKSNLPFSDRPHQENQLEILEVAMLIRPKAQKHR